MSASEYITVPTHPRLLVQAWPDDDGLVRLAYIGDADVLIAAGLATADILAPRKKPGAPRGARTSRRTDREHSYVDRYYVVRDGQPIRRCRLYLRRERQNALRLPGAMEALEAHAEAERRAEAQEAERAHRELTAALTREREWEAAQPSDESFAELARAARVTLH